jgi:hypothetical protein
VPSPRVGVRVDGAVFGGADVVGSDVGVTVAGVERVAVGCDDLTGGVVARGAGALVVGATVGELVVGVEPPVGAPVLVALSGRTRR